MDAVPKEEVKKEEEEKGKIEAKATEEEEAVMGEDKKVDEEKITQKGKEEVVAEEEEEEEVKVEIEPKTGVAFPVNLEDGKKLCSLGLRMKNILTIGLKIYAFGMYADNAKLKELLKANFTKAPERPTKQVYEAAINSDVGMMVRLVIVFGSLTMSMVRNNFDQVLGASLKKLTGGGQKTNELVHKVMGAAKDSIKLPTGSVIEISRIPGYVLQTRVKNEVVSKVESELLCRSYFHMYLGDEPFDKEAKERFGTSLLSLF